MIRRLGFSVVKTELVIWVRNVKIVSVEKNNKINVQKLKNSTSIFKKLVYLNLLDLLRDLIKIQDKCLQCEQVLRFVYARHQQTV